jgi:hypothetical protein
MDSIIADESNLLALLSGSRHVEYVNLLLVWCSVERMKKLWWRSERLWFVDVKVERKT